MTLVVLAAGFTSCSNDDIPMEEKIIKKVFDTTFIVDPSGVVEPYRFEWTAGELSIVPDGAQLRLRILIYDSNGEIVGNILTQKQSNYQSTWSVKTELEAGTYTAFVISDVINTNNPNVEEYWKLENYGRLNDAKLTKTPRYLGYQKEILGICIQQFSVESLNSSISFDLKPAGAACYYYLENWESYPIDLWFCSNMKIQSIFWDASYNLKIEKELSDNSEYELGGVELPIESVHSSFVYLLPSKNQHFRFWGETDDTQGFVGNDMSIAEIKAGEQYFFYCYFSSLFNNYAFTEYYNVTGKTFDEWYEEWLMESSKVYQNSRLKNISNEIATPMLMNRMHNAVYIKDFIKK